MLRVGIYRPRQCAEGLLCPPAHFQVCIVIPTAWVSLFCSVHSTGFPRTLTTNKQESDTPLSSYVDITITL